MDTFASLIWWIVLAEVLVCAALYVVVDIIEHYGDTWGGRSSRPTRPHSTRKPPP